MLVQSRSNIGHVRFSMHVAGCATPMVYPFVFVHENFSQNNKKSPMYTKWMRIPLPYPGSISELVVPVGPKLYYLYTVTPFIFPQ